MKKIFWAIAKSHSGDGYVFWYSKLKKYVIVDYISDIELDNVSSLKTMDSICDVVEYLESEFKQYFGL